MGIWRFLNTYLGIFQKKNVKAAKILEKKTFHEKK